MSEGETVQTARGVQRHRVLKAGKVVLPGNSSVVDCTVRDLSAVGARLGLGDMAALPEEFRLVVLSDNTVRDARVIWRRPGAVGVAFTSEARRAPPRKW